MDVSTTHPTKPMSEKAIHDDSATLIGPGHTFGTITDKISEIALVEPKKTPVGWLAVTGVASVGVLILLASITQVELQARTEPIAERR